MATALGYNEISEVETHINDISTLVSDWTTYQKDFEDVLNSDVGKIFAENFSIGTEQTAKISRLIEILIEMQENINTLIQDSNDFCEAQRRANMDDN